MTGVNYVVVSWSGRRRVNPEAYIRDPGALLKAHMESLERLRHNLSQITLVINKNPEEPKAYRKAVEAIPSMIGKTRVVVLERGNVGYSYGAYSFVFGRYRTTFQYYLLMEDDYRLCVDDFDRKMVEMLDVSGAGFLTFCLRNATRPWIVDRAKKESPRGHEVSLFLSRTCPNSFQYPQVCLGMARARTLNDVWMRHDRLPHSTGKSHPENKFEGQFGLVAAIQKEGWRLHDMVPSYRVKEHDPQGNIHVAGGADRPLMAEPIQPLL